MQGFAVRSIPAKPPRKGSSKNVNSLQAQPRGKAFINSQRHEGWVCLPAAYDDAGFSDTMLDRPALQLFRAACPPQLSPLGHHASHSRRAQPADLTADKLLAHSR